MMLLSESEISAILHNVRNHGLASDSLSMSVFLPLYGPVTNNHTPIFRICEYFDDLKKVLGLIQDGILPFL